MPANPLKNTHLWYALAFAAAGVVGASAGGAQTQTPSPQPAGDATCRVEGRITSGSDGLPGASVVVHVGGVLKAATSTDIEGRYTIIFSPGATYHLTAELTAFAPVERDLTLGAPPCDTRADFELALKSRREPIAPATPAANPATSATASTSSPPTASPPQNAAPDSGQPQRVAGGRGGGRAGGGNFGGR